MIPRESVLTQEIAIDRDRGWACGIAQLRLEHHCEALLAFFPLSRGLLESFDHANRIWMLRPAEAQGPTALRYCCCHVEDRRLAQLKRLKPHFLHDRGIKFVARLACGSR